MAKIDSLKSSGSYNEKHQDVKTILFNCDDFYDPSDIVQVRYEMLRGVREHNLSVDEAVKQYGMSRTTYYNAKDAFEHEGVVGLLPVKRGPKGRRLDPKADLAIDSYLLQHPRATASEVCKYVCSETGIIVSESTMRRVINEKKEQSV